MLLFVVAPWLARHTLGAPQLTFLRIGALTLLFSAINGAQAGALYGFEAFQITARLQAITGLADIPLMLGGYFLGGLNGVLCGMAISRFLTLLLMCFAVRAEARRYHMPISLGDWRQELHALWEFTPCRAGRHHGGSRQLDLLRHFGQPTQRLCRHGHIQCCQPVVHRSDVFIPTMLGSALLPVLSERIGEHDNEGSGRIVRTMFKLNSGIVLPIGIAMSIASPWIMRIYGADYRHAWPTLVAVVWTAVILGIINPVGDVIAASGRMWLGLINAGWAAVYILSTVLLVRWAPWDSPPHA